MGGGGKKKKRKKKRNQTGKKKRKKEKKKKKKRKARHRRPLVGSQLRKISLDRCIIVSKDLRKIRNKKQDVSPFLSNVGYVNRIYVVVVDYAIIIEARKRLAIVLLK